MSQETMKSDVFLKLGYCWNLEVIDVCGDKYIDDNAFINLQKAEKVVPDQLKPINPGLVNLKVLKVGGCTISETGFFNMCKVTPNIEHLEITKVDVSDIALKNIINSLTKLTFIDLSGVTAANYAFLDELKTTRPSLLTKRYNIAEVDKKDNGLRVPRRVVEKKKKRRRVAKEEVKQFIVIL